ncbi:putative ABC transport system permease protein [Singulisphaera sp. GP187]|uniref:ABC transporter permease n=1 Tax=Singulisphaera sp. GP187 TaxID=1882752 RepID=UPI000928A691|nr:ABC transporter permease [Singulisphaera sp. GP187]SIN95513.1 putative ABC transport system permease protein [Singulisphaera sp. GP187]
MNKVWNIVRLAVRNLGLHKLRVLLTALGLIFGVSSVIAMLAIAEGASAEAQKQLAELGATNVILKSTKPVDDVNPSKQSNDSFVFNYGLTKKDFERIMNTIPTVVGATPLREFRKNVRHLDHELEGRIVGANPDCLKITGQKLAKGRFLTDLDMSLATNVAVIGAEVSKKLFPFGDPLGKAVRLGESHYYRIIGVTTYKAPSGGTGSSLSAQDLNKDVYIPLTTDRARFGEVLMGEKQGQFSAERIELSQITVTVRGMDDVKSTASALESMLRQFHPKVDYSITVPLELLEKAEATKRIFNLVLGSIAGISLIVGGIGIMNIMLATVSERTREIGIRRALGAKRRDIILQFLIETVVISASGGGIGVILGIAVPPLVSHFSGVPAVIRPESPFIAFIIALVIGVVFGVYPARRAAMMDPVEALRSE